MPANALEAIMRGGMRSPELQVVYKGKRQWEAIEESLKLQGSSIEAAGIMSSDNTSPALAVLDRMGLSMSVDAASGVSRPGVSCASLIPTHPTFTVLDRMGLMMSVDAARRVCQPGVEYAALLLSGGPRAPFSTSGYLRPIEYSAPKG